MCLAIAWRSASVFRAEQQAELVAGVRAHAGGQGFVVARHDQVDRPNSSCIFLPELIDLRELAAGVNVQHGERAVKNAFRVSQSKVVESLPMDQSKAILGKWR